VAQLIVFIFLTLSFILLPYPRIFAQTLVFPPEDQSAVPSQLKPPSEDVAQLDEVIDDEAEEKIYHIPMILNDSVENHMEYFKTRGRDVFQMWLDRSVRYMPVMKEIFRKKNLPEDLVYVAMIESGFNPYAVSWARAVGPWQFMPATASCTVSR
jgi:membrane-bound lytic murein transglycosylase D